MKSLYFGNRDLEQLSEQELQVHYENICEAAGIPSALNLLRYRKMDDGTGSGRKHLVLYATKGATDAIRGVQGINDIDMTESMIGTAYVVTTKVQNEKGRTLFAKGSVDLEGKKGKALENAIALAQTRSSRRAALAISGLGLLDESELGDIVQNPVSDAPTPLPVVKQPLTKANSAVGKDITESTGLTLKAPPSGKHVSVAEVTSDTDPISSRLAHPAFGKHVSAAEAASGTDSVLVDPVVETRLPNPAAGLKVASDNLAGPGLNRAGRVIEKPAEPVQVVAAAPLQVVVAAEELEEPMAGPEPKKTRKKRTPKNVTEQVAAEPEAGLPSTSTEKESHPVAAPGAKATVATLNMPNQEQMKNYVARLSDLRENILPADGLIQSHGMGTNAKIRKFFSVANNNTEDLSKLTVAQWESTFSYIDGILAKGVRGELSKSINYNIGAVDELAAQ
jgi:hypothetical protein